MHVKSTVLIHRSNSNHALRFSDSSEKIYILIPPNRLIFRDDGYRKCIAVLLFYIAEIDVHGLDLLTV